MDVIHHDRTNDDRGRGESRLVWVLRWVSGTLWWNARGPVYPVVLRCDRMYWGSVLPY